MVLVLSCDSCSLPAGYGVPQVQGMLWFLCYHVIVVASWIAMEYLRYCAYRNSVNNAFLRLFRYVRTDRTMTIKI